MYALTRRNESELRDATKHTTEHNLPQAELQKQMQQICKK